ncbi:Probable amino-acid import ATP-binding protein YxeO [Listeria grayi]|uniref:Probable amino-acid import ATP-binding protein YxeO n=1 Tax=Listeria grayi TaxID=1641 RepID=A0A378MAX0_LISGR|nr:Probable amino-acid import ATP-binding protein YxeO [Listeria grayi]
MLKIKNVTKKFDDRLILDNVSLTLADNEILSIVGPSGGGKTTLLRCISGLETMDSGEIWIDEEKIDFENKKSQLNRLVSFFKSSTSSHI